MAFVIPTLVYGTASAIGQSLTVVISDLTGKVSWSTVPDGSTVDYVIQDNPADAIREWGLGTKMTVAGSPALIRSAANVLGGSGGVGVLANFTASKQIIYAAPLGERASVSPNLSADPAVSSPGQIVYRTDTNQLRVYAGATPAWVNVIRADAASFTISPTSPTASSGTGNEAWGNGALASITSGSNNTALGYQALNSNTTGIDNVGVGYQSLLVNTTGIANTAVGHQSLFTNTSGQFNVAIGYQAMYSNTTGSNNTAEGLQALYSNTTGGNNASFGYLSLHNNTTGSSNASFGFSALSNSTSGTGNVAFGFQALSGNTAGSSNVGIGYQSLISVTTGNNNTAFGYNSGQGQTSGVALTVGSNNSILGFQADVKTIATSNAIALGSAAQAGSNEFAISPHVTITTWHGMDASAVDQAQFIITNSFTDSTHASWKGAVDFQVGDFNNAARTFFSADASGSAARISWFGGTKVPQQNTTGTTQQTSAGTGTAIKTDSTTTGGVGTTAYTVADIVLALKNYNLLAA